MVSTTPELIGVGDFFELEGKVRDIISASSSWLPEIGQWPYENHEVHQAGVVSEFSYRNKSEKNRSQIIKSSLRILVALLARTETKKGYKDIVFPGNYFQFYPINLNSLVYHSEQTWNNLTVKEWVYWLCSNWGINTHLKIALRKLRGQSQSTFRIRPSDRGLEVTSVPEAVFARPGFINHCAY